MPAEDLLQTKLTIPILRSKLVSRGRLIDRLRSGLQSKLILVSAPAGSGKTTLVSEVIRDAGIPAGWISLDEYDNDPARFWSYFIAALQTIKADIGAAVLGTLKSPQMPPIESILTALINEIMSVTGDFVVVLDDYHVIESQPIHAGIAFLLDRSPPTVHLVMASRADPPLPLSRLRGRAAMMEIRADDLRFTRDETATFMNKVMDLGVSDADIVSLESRTEGWITGLQMAALSLQGRDDISGFISDFTGSHRYILDYLIDEVLGQQPAEVQNFLLQTSILDRLSAPLCNAVTDRDDSENILLSLEHRNLFIIPLDQSRRWFRYEHLFADLLRHQLGLISGAEQVKLLHARAGGWYEENGFPAEAIHHAISASDWERSARLIGDIGDDLMKKGQIVTLVNWAKALPEEILLKQASLFGNYVWALILTGQIEIAEMYLVQAEKYVPKNSVALGNIIAMQAYIARTRGNHGLTIQLSEQALSLLPTEDVGVRCILWLNLGMARWQSGNLEEAFKAFTEADSTGVQSHNEYAAITARSFLGVIEAARGNLERATAILQEVARSYRSPAGALGFIYLSAVLYERNELKEAFAQVQRGVELSQQSGNREMQIGGYRLLALIQQAMNDTGGALATLDKMDELTEQYGNPTLERARNVSCHVLVALAQQDISNAVKWAEKMPEDADVSPFYPRLNLTRARVMMAQGKKAEATVQLRRNYRTAVDYNWRFAQVEVRTLQALAATDAPAAMALLTEALQIGQEAGCVRTFLDKGEPLAVLLVRAKSQGIVPEYVSRLLGYFQTESGDRRYSRAARTVPSTSLAEPLSERELAVLQLMSAGYSNREIAEKLIIGTGTVKSHVHSIIGKLAVSSRTQAVIKAREIELI